MPIINTRHALFVSAITSALMTIAIATPSHAEFSYIGPNLLAQVPVMSISGVGLEQGINEIIPEGFSVSYAPGVKKTENIQWSLDRRGRSGQAWPDTLAAALKPAGLQFTRSGTKILISNRPLEKSIRRNWSVKKGQKLSDILDSWGELAKVRVRFLTDRDWPIAADHHFVGDFEDVTRMLLEALSDSTPAPVGELTNNRQLLLILGSTENQSSL